MWINVLYRSGIWHGSTSTGTILLSSRAARVNAARSSAVANGPVK
jgi:hypothetical protein